MPGKDERKGKEEGRRRGGGGRAGKKSKNTPSVPAYALSLDLATSFMID